MEEHEGEDGSVGGMIKPIVRSRIERLRSDIPERTVFDEEDGIGRGAEMAVDILGGVVAGVAAGETVAAAAGVEVELGVELTVGVEETVADAGFVGETKERLGLALASAALGSAWALVELLGLRVAAEP